jgi:hypothetical protein
MKKGDPVEILTTIAELQPRIECPILGQGFIKKSYPQYGRVTDIDGGYIYVKPKYRKWVTECYSCELRILDEKEYKTVRNYRR